MDFPELDMTSKEIEERYSDLVKKLDRFIGKLTDYNPPSATILCCLFLIKLSLTNPAAPEYIVKQLEELIKAIQFLHYENSDSIIN